MDPAILTTKNRRVTRIVEYYNNLCEKESRAPPNDAQLPSLRLRIARIRELIAILSLYEDKIKYLTVDSNRIIPCNDDDKERIKFTDCKIRLVLQIVRQSFWNTSSNDSGYLSGSRQSQTFNPFASSSSAPLQHLILSSQTQTSGHSSFPTVNVEFILAEQYPSSRAASCLSVQISKVQNFSAVKTQILQELLSHQLKNESGPEVLFDLIWAVTYFLHVLDSYDDNDALLHCGDSSRLISQLVSVHPKHLTNPSLLDSFVQARHQSALDTKRKRKNAQLDQFRVGFELSDIPVQTFAIAPSDLIPSILDKKSADSLCEILTSFQFKDKHCDKNREITLRLEKKITHCIYIKKLCCVRHRQEYSAFEQTSGLSFRFLRVAFELKPLKSDARDLADTIEQICKSILYKEVFEKLEKVLKIELSRGCQFVEPVHFSFEFEEDKAEFYLLSEMFPTGGDEYCSLEALSKTILFHESGLQPNLRYRFLEQVLVGFSHIHKAQFAHGTLEPQKIFVNSNGSMKIYDVFLEAAAMQLIPFVIDSDSISVSKIERSIVQSLVRDDLFNVGSLVLALWSNDCKFESISNFLPDSIINSVQEAFQERFSKLKSQNCAHFVKECFKIYEHNSELQVQSLLNHAFVLDWQKKNIQNEPKKLQILDSTKEDVEDGEEKIPSSYGRSQSEFLPVMALGKGAFGSVFMVRNEIDGTEYALKCIHLRDTEAAKNNLRREVGHLARLLHPNVVRYYSAWFEYDAGQWKYLIPSDNGDELNLDGSDSEYDYDDEDEELSESNLQSGFSDIPESEYGDGDSIVEFARDSKDGSCLNDTHDSSRPVSRPNIGGKREKSEFEKKGFKLTLCIQMELCDSLTLYDKIRSGVLIEDAQARYRILQEMANALAYIHEKNIIHRDLKPSNVFFVKGKVKLGDFGLARTTKQDPNAKDVTDDGGPFRKVSTVIFGSNRRNKKMSINFSSANTLHIGTAQYMAPEVMSDSRYNQKIDLFSYGVIYFEMCYPMTTMSERARLLMNIRPTKSTQSIYPEDMEKYFRPIEIDNLKKLLSINPSERPAAIDLINSNIFVREDSAPQLDAQMQGQREELKCVELNYISQSNLNFMVNRLLENSTSPQFRYVVRSLMDRTMSLIDSISYDYDPDRHSLFDDQLKKTVNFNLIKLHFEHLTSTFGALKLANISTLLPEFYSREDAVKICDENGILCDLPYDRRMLLSRYFAFNAQNVEFMTCSNFSPIYRKSPHGPFHPRQVWTASFDQIWSQSWSEHRILPFCELLTLSTRVLSPILHRGQLIYHLTCLETLKAIIDHLKVSDQVWRALLKFLRNNGEKILVQSVDELKLSFQVIFESAGVHEKIHRFLFSLLKISESSPGEMLKAILSTCQEFDVPEFPELSQKLHSLVHSLETVVNLYLISTAVFLNEEIQTRVRFRFGLSLLTKTSVEYQDLAIHVVYEDLQCERGTLLAVGGRFDGAIEKQENMLQQIMPSDLQDALSGDKKMIDLNSDTESSRKHSLEVQFKQLSLISDSVRTNPSLPLDNTSSLIPTKQQFNKRIAAGLTFSIDKLIRLEWSTEHLQRTIIDPPKNSNYLTDVVIVTTMSSIDACKVIQQLRTYNLRVQVLPELFSLTEKEHFRELFSTKSPSKVNSSGVGQKNKPDFGILQNVIHYVKNSKVHFILLIDSFKKHEYGNISQINYYSVIEHSLAGMNFYRFFEDSIKACRFVSGNLSPLATPTTDRQAQRSVFRLRQRRIKLLSSEKAFRGTTEEDDISHLLEEETFPRKRQRNTSSLSEAGQEKIFTVKERNKSKRSSSKEYKSATARKEKAKECRILAKRSLSETQIRRSRSGSVISSDQTPDQIDVGFVAGHRIDRQLITVQVNEFILSKLPYLINAEDKLKVLATNLIPFELLRTFADTVSDCFTDPESVFDNITDNAARTLRSFSNRLASLKLKNRPYSDPLERIGQKLWSWVEDKIHYRNEHPEDKICLIVLMHVGERPFRYRLFSVDLYCQEQIDRSQ